MVVLEAMAAHGVKKLIYSSTCATYGEPEKMPITEVTPQVRVLHPFFFFFEILIVNWIKIGYIVINIIIFIYCRT